MIRLARKKHYFIVALVLVSFLFTFVVPAFAQEGGNGEGNGGGSQKIEAPAPPSSPNPPANGTQENFSSPGQENKGSEVGSSKGPENNPSQGGDNPGKGHEGDNPGKGHEGDNPGKGHEGDNNQFSPPSSGDQGSGNATGSPAGPSASPPSDPNRNEGVGQDPEQSNKVTAAMVPIEKLVVQTLRSDQTTVVYPPTRVGGGDGDRWPAVPIGGYVDYRITVTNNSGRALFNVKVWDNPPPHTQYVSSTLALSSIGPGHKLNWIVDLGVGSTVVINLRLRILEKAPKVRTNEAKTEFCSSAVTQVAILEEEGPPPEKKFSLSIEKSVDKDKAMVGEVLTYTISYSNTGDQPLTEVVITDPIPDKAEYVAGSATAGGTLTSSTLTWNIGTLGVGGSGSVSFQVKIKEGASGTVTNVATIDSKETDPKSDDAATRITSPPEILPTAEFNLSILKVVSHETAKPGDILVYAIHWANTGKSTLTKVVITDAIPAGTTYIEGSATTDHNATVSLEGGILVWRFDKIDPNTSGIYTFSVTINSDTRGVVGNTAVIDSDQTDPQSSTARTTVVAVAPAVFGPPTSPVLVAAPPTPLRRVPGALPVTGANLLVYFLSAVFLIGTGIGLQRLK